MESVFLHFALILLTAFLVSFLIRALKQPVIIGYIIAGVIISPFIIGLGTSKELIQIFSEFGIAFLLFMVGLHLNPKVIKEIGIPSLVIGIVQIALTFALGFLVSFYLLGFNLLTSSYIGIALTFSSTIIIMKLLSDKRQIDSLYGKMSIGILIIEDIVAVIVLMLISSSANDASLGYVALRSLLGGGALIVLLFLVGYFVLPRFTRVVAKSNELLFLFSITWAFLISALFNFLGFSIEIGALLAGVVLSVNPYSAEISSKIRPLRDFFLVIFFIILGLNVQISDLGSIVVNALIFSVIALAFKPLSLMVLMAMFGYTKRNNFLVGTTLSQISEFSLIVLSLGVSVGHISEGILSTFTLAAIITIAASTYLISFSNDHYNKVSGFASLFERKKIKEKRKVHRKYNAILFGYNRIGFSILRAFKKVRKKYIVADFNPDVISTLERFKIPCVYGDAYDYEFLEELPLDTVNLVVSTIPDFETNIIITETVKKENPKAVIIARAHQISDALELYKRGADYVLTPHFLGGEYVADMISEFNTDESDYRKERNKHIKMLEEIEKRGKKR